MTNLVPTADNIIVKEVVPTNTTASGIVLQGGKDQTKTALVVAVGEDVKAIKVGQEIGVNWSKGFKFKTLEFDGAIIKEEDVLVIINK